MKKLRKIISVKTCFNKKFYENNFFKNRNFKFLFKIGFFSDQIKSNE